MCILYSVHNNMYSNVPASCTHMQIRLIVSDMSLTRCQAWHWLLYPLLAVDALLGVAYVLPGGRVAPFVRAWELTALYTLALLATLQQLHYGYCLIYELADFLNIRPFSVGSLTVSLDDSGPEPQPQPEP